MNSQLVTSFPPKDSCWDFAGKTISDFAPNTGQGLSTNLKTEDADVNIVEHLSRLLEAMGFTQLPEPRAMAQDHQTLLAGSFN